MRLLVVPSCRALMISQGLPLLISMPPWQGHVLGTEGKTRLALALQSQYLTVDDALVKYMNKCYPEVQKVLNLRLERCRTKIRLRALFL